MKVFIPCKQSNWDVDFDNLRITHESDKNRYKDFSKMTNGLEKLVSYLLESEAKVV